ncbi:MAG TPA: DMT family transporter [Thermoanaerobaculia bacterium]
MKNHRLAVAALFLVAAAWGATFTLVKHVLTLIAPEPFIFLRFTAAGIVLLVIAIAMRKLPRAAIRPGIVLGALIFAGYWCQTRGLMTISPSRSAFLTGLYVVMVPFCDRLLFAKRVAARAWLGCVLAAAGTTLLIGGIDARADFGDLLTIAGAICFAMHVILSAKYSATTPSLGLAAVQVLVVGLAAVPPSLFVPRPRMTAAVIAVILFTAMVTTALAFVALMWGQSRVTATEAVVILAFEPMAASITSIVFEHEPVTAGFIAGAATIVGAMVLSQLPASPRRDPMSA